MTGFVQHIKELFGFAHVYAAEPRVTHIRCKPGLTNEALACTDGRIGTWI